MKNLKTLLNYKILQKIGESAHAEVYKARRQNKPEQLFVLKIIKPGITTRNLPSYLNQQIEYMKNIHLPGVIIPSALNQEETTPIIVQEYFNGVNLHDWMKSQIDVSLDNFFEIACSLAGILDVFHRAGCIHKGIKQNNILISPDTLDIRLIDPIRFFDMSEISHFLFDEGFKVNTLNYLSPEQTGRIKQRVEYTTDFYSLGVVFYELLSGTLPFASSDSLQIIHSHLAEKPVSLNKRKPKIPEVLSDIVARLMQKEPEKRYQTGSGLLHDLRICQENYNRTGKISSFPLGQNDFSSRINIPSIMVGRDKEKESLLEEYRLTYGGAFRFAIISGLPGIGKTRLIQELQIPIVNSRGYFTSGKYDQYQKNIPYNTLIQAFKNLTRTYLTEDTARIKYWEETINCAVRPNARLITDMIPELSLIIGPQPEVPDLPPVESKSRFNMTIDKFISCLSGENHPLTLFIDDLQWCDMATFNIIETILANPEGHPYLFIIGAYRHNEVDEDHRLIHLLQKTRDVGNPLLELSLEELEPRFSNEMISYILNTSPARTEKLSEMINITSNGNPLYINESVSWLHNGNLLRLDAGGIWQWDMEKIEKSELPDTSVELFTDKIKRLPQKTLELLQIAACLGPVFSMEDLIMITDKYIPTFYKDLTVAFSEKILIKSRNHLSFFHDRVQEAVYSTIDKEKKRALHAHIAETYIQEILDGTNLESLENLFDLTEHLNKSRDTSPDKQILYRDALFNYHAGKKAMDSLALDAANKYFKQSFELISDDSWEENYEFTFALYKNLAQSELTQGNQKKTKELLDILLKKSRTDIDRAECLMEQAAALVSLVDSKKAIDLANQGLEYLGKGIPDDPEKLNEKIAMYQKKLEEQDIDINKIAEKPLLKDRKTIIELRLYNLILPSYYLLGMQYPFILSTSQAMHLVQESEGVNDMCSYMIVVHSIQLLFQGDYEKGFTYSKQADCLFQRFPNTPGTVRAMSALVWVTEHWRSPISEVINMCQRVIETSKNLGDIYRAGQGYSIRIWANLFQCRDLKEIEENIQRCLRYSLEYNHAFSRDLAEGIIAAWVEPMNNLKQQVSLDERIAEWEESRNFALLGSYYVHRAAANYYLCNYKQADHDIKYSESFHIRGNISHFEWHVYYVLNSLRLLDEEPDVNIRQSIMDNIQPAIETIKLWSGFGPSIRPYLAIIRAELKRAEGEFKEARNLYLEAIDTAGENEYRLLEGHTSELLGEYLLSKGYSTGSAYIKEAAAIYEKCHAAGKLTLLKEKYHQYFTPEDTGHVNELPAFQRLDAAFLMKALKAISQELELEELLKTIMISMMEGSGAAGGYLLTATGDELIIRAQCIKKKTLMVDLIEEQLTDARDISSAIIRYVQRTKKTVTLGNAMEEGTFTNDKDVQKLKLRSILCQPLVKQQRLVGIIYLQNNLIKSVFTEEQIELVRLLTSHAAIAMENAMLVYDMKIADEALRESEEKFRSLVENATDVIMHLNREGTILFANRAPSGISLNDVIGKNLLIFINSYQHEEIKKIHKRVWESGEPGSYECSGSITNLWYNSIVSPIVKGGNVIALTIITRDITDRKMVEEALRESELRYRTLFESAPIGISISNFDGRILTFNDTILDRTGYSREEFREINLRHIYIDPKDRDVLINKLQSDGFVQDYEVKLKRKDGASYIARLSMKQFNLAGEKVFLTTSEDITERKQVEEELAMYRNNLEELVKERTKELHQTQQKLLVTERLAVLGQVSGSISHEIRNPLSIIDSSAYFLKMKLGNTDPKIDQHLERIRVNIRRSTAIIESLLNLTKIKKPAMEPINLSLLVDEVASALKPPGKIKVSMRMPDNNLSINGDFELLRMAFKNIIRNAYDAMGDKGTLEIRGDIADESKFVRLIFEDTGPGIEPDNIEIIFQPLFSTKTVGIGFGLSICQQVIERHGGTIEAKSELGNGTSIIIHLPVAPDLRDEEPGSKDAGQE